VGRRRRRDSTARRAWILAVVVVVAAVLWITLSPVPQPGAGAGTNLRPLEHHGRALEALFHAPQNRDAILYYLVSDVLGNILLFLPLGFVCAGALGGGRTAVRRLAAVGGLGLALSISIEAIQLLIPGRATDVDDVIFNALGAVVGGALLLVGERLFASRSRRSGRRRKRTGAAGP